MPAIVPHGAARTLGRMQFETLAIHAGQEPDPTTGAVVPPIYQVSTYKQDGVGGLRGGYEYSRSANPTRTALEECLAAIEGGRRGLAFASGLAAEDTLLRAVCRPGDHVVDPGRRVRRHVPAVRRRSSSGGASTTRRSAGHGVDAVPRRDPPGQHQGRLGRDADQPAARHHRHRRGRRARPRRRRAARRRQHVRLAVPAAAARARRGRRRALDDEVHGRALRRGRRCAGARRRRAGRAGGLPPERDGRGRRPFDSWLVLRGIKTLGVRMDRHCANAERVVEVLAAHPRGHRGVLPGPARAPRARGRRQADEGVRRHGVLPGRRRRGRRRSRSATAPRCSSSASRWAASSR